MKTEIYIDGIVCRHYISEAEKLNKAIQLLQLAEDAKNKMRVQRENIATWTNYSFWSKCKWEDDLRTTQAAHDRIIKSFQKQIEKLHRTVYTLKP